MWVPLIENNEYEGDGADFFVKKHINKLLSIDPEIDTILLGCTHYPLLIPILRDLLPADVRLVDSATTCAEHLKKELTRLDLLQSKDQQGSLEIHLTDLSEEFEALARHFLSKSPGRIRRAVLGG